jgi:hypothetical protein
MTADARSKKATADARSKEADADARGDCGHEEQ